MNDKRLSRRVLYHVLSKPHFVLFEERMRRIQMPTRKRPLPPHRQTNKVQLSECNANETCRKIDEIGRSGTAYSVNNSVFIACTLNDQTLLSMDFPGFAKLLFMVKQSQYFPMPAKQPKSEPFDCLVRFSCGGLNIENVKLASYYNQPEVHSWSGPEFILCGFCMLIKFIELFGFWWAAQNIAENHKCVKTENCFDRFSQKYFDANINALGQESKALNIN